MATDFDVSLMAASHDAAAWQAAAAEMASLDATAPPDEDLSEWLEGDLDAEVVDGDPPPDIEFADRMLRKIARLNREIAEVVARADRERERVDNYERERNSGKLRERARLEAWLDSWMRAHEACTGRVTENLLNGELTLRPGQPSFVCADPKAFYELCMTMPSERAKWVERKTVYQPDAGKLRHLLKPGKALGPADEKGIVSYNAHDPHTGELVPGIVLRKPAQKKFDYKVT